MGSLGPESRKPSGRDRRPNHFVLSILNPAKTKLLRLVCAVIWISAFFPKGNCQPDVPLQEKDVLSFIDSQLVHFNSSTTLPSLLSAIETHCDSEPGCLIGYYKKLSYKLERKFSLYAAIYVEGEIIKQAQKLGDKSAEAEAYYNLSRFNGAKGYYKLAAINRDQAIEAAKESDCYKIYIQSSFIKYQDLLLRGEMSSFDSLFPELLRIAEEKKDSSTQYWLRRNLVYYYIDVNDYDRASDQIAILENYLRNDALDSSNYLERMRIPFARGKIALAKQQYATAEAYFKEAENLSGKAPDYWVQASSLFQLAAIAKQLGHNREYLKYLNQVLDIANERELLDHLIRAYAEKAAYLEETGDYKGAIGCLKNSKAYEDDWKARQADFDAENLLLLKEKQKLEAEKESQSLALSIEKQQTRMLRWATVIAVLLLAFLGWSYYQRTKTMKKIADQKNTIELQAEELKTLDKAKSRFFANISHEFRTPLTLILGSVAKLRSNENLTSEQENQLRRLSKSSDHLLGMVNQILDLRKLESGKLVVKAEPTRIATFYYSLAAQFESLAGQNSIGYSYTSSIPSETWLQLDREIFRVILHNLLGNAFKFTEGGQIVESALTLKNNQLHLTIKDRGRGIHPDDIPSLFDLYFQSKDGTSATEGGTGIGLSLCHEYARLLGGDITVESALGKGTEFSVWFPVEFAEATEGEFELEPGAASFAEQGTRAAIKTIDRNPPNPNSTAQKVLLVEDNPDLRKYIHELLRKSFRVVEARNGKEALEKLNETQDISLVISDLMMPVMDGQELLKRIKNDPKYYRLPFIMLTARADSDTRLSALRFGVDDYLTKPFEEAELLARVTNLLRNYHRRMEESEKDTQAASMPEQQILSKDREWLAVFEKYILDNIANELLNIADLADRFNMSESSLLRQLKRLTGLSPKQYLMEVRLNKARQLLDQNAFKTVSEVANQVGYSNLRTFSRVFKERFGKPPSSHLS